MLAVPDSPPEVALVTILPRGHSSVFRRIGSALARGFSELGVRFDVVYLGGERRSTSDGVVRVVEFGADLRTALRPLGAYLNAARPKVTIACPPPVALPALVAGRLTNHPVIPWEAAFFERQLRASGSLQDLPLKSRLILGARRAAYRWAPAVAVVSRDVGAAVFESLSWLDVGRIHQLPNPLDIETITPLADEPPPFDRSRFVICTAARLSHEKGIDVALEALRECKDELPSDWMLAVLGDGGLRDELEMLAKRLDLTSRVHFLGRLENPYPAIRSASLFVHPARWDGFGLVLAEALALGTPIVATACPGGPREILDEGEHGLLVPAEDPSALAEAIAGLAADADAREKLTRHGPERVQAYAPRAIAARMLEIAEVVERAVPAPRGI
jgi:glycosyltransferase involved in cell wall biosynthesis